MKIYISGKITGDPNYREKFAAAEKFYYEQGAIVLNSATHPGGMDRSDYMRICFAMIDSADTVVMLNDWPTSEGAKAEFAYAKYIGKNIAKTTRF